MRRHLEVFVFLSVVFYLVTQRNLVHGGRIGEGPEKEVARNAPFQQLLRRSVAWRDKYGREGDWEKSGFVQDLNNMYVAYY